MSTRSGYKFRRSSLFNSVTNPKIRRVKQEKMATLTPDKVIDVVAKIMPSDYNGCPLMLNNAIDRLEILRESVNHEDNQKLLISLIKAKFSGKARDALNDDITTVNDIISALKQNCKGQSSWQIATTLEGIRVGNRAKYVTDLNEITEKLKHAFILEGTSKDAANRYSINAVTKNIRANYASNPVMVSAMTSEFTDINEVIHKFESIQIEKEATVLQLRNQSKNHNKFFRNNNNRNNNPNKRYNGNHDRKFMNYNSNQHKSFYSNSNNNGRYKQGNNQGNNRNIRTLTCLGNDVGPEGPGNNSLNQCLDSNSDTCQCGNRLMQCQCNNVNVTRHQDSE